MFLFNLHYLNLPRASHSRSLVLHGTATIMVNPYSNATIHKISRNLSLAQADCFNDQRCPQPQYVDGMWHDYNSFYYGPCTDPWIIWNDSGCEGVEVPFCDPNTCTQSCIQFLNYDKGICHNQECYCRKSETTPKPTPDPDWTYDNQNGSIFAVF